MKNVILASALAAAGLLVGSAGGRPLYHKRELVTKVVYVTEVVAEVVIYVDEGGAAFSTSTSVMVPAMAMSSVLSSSTSQAALPKTTSSSIASIVFTTASPTPAVAPESSSAAPVTTEALEPAAQFSSVAESPSSSIEPSPPPVEPSLPLAEPSAPPVAPHSPPSPPSLPPAESHPPPAEPYLPPAALPSPPVEQYLPPAAPPSPTAVPPSPPPSAAPAPSDNLSESSLPMGITWDVYTGASECKSEAEIASEFSRMKDFKVIRLYGMDCNQISLGIQNALKNGQKLMGGAYLDAGGSGEDVSKVIQTYKNAIDQHAGGNWDVIQLFTVENERVNEGRMTAAQVVDAIGRARTQLRQLGYNGPVGAVETAPATINNPSICEASDVVMVNIHAFFDKHTQAPDAGPFVKSQVELVQSACNNKRVVVTESGWPRQGSPNGEAIPSAENQRIALQSIRESFSGDMFLFSAFDSSWKVNTASTFNAERFWGVIQ
ncbi:glycoside hydrolase family 17 protein [Bipolaris maydis]|nr:glycoside hydrolase family 17 protein [Bipolaris maydis]